MTIESIQNAGIGFAIFAIAYLSNMCFSLYYNIKIDKEKFSKEKILNSLFKILTFAFGVVGLVLSTSLIVPWASNNGLTVPAEYAEVISVLATLGVCLSATLKYIQEAFNKMRKILTVTNESETVAQASKEKKDGA